MLNNLIEKTRNVWQGLRSAESARSTQPPVDHRISRRVDIDLNATVQIFDLPATECVVSDASASGLRFTLPHAVASGTVARVDIPFNGRTLRARVRLTWARRRQGAFEVGGRILPETVESGLLQNFALYLRWRETFRLAS
ncbi:MAG: PilZ domain-containing protein [Armatimonadetes bacterium]|nr:PilZ domain-containing protein [Armatimonadota bacterium]